VGFDELKDKAMGLAKDHPDQVDKGIDKAGEFADQKTGGQHSDQIKQGADKVKQAFGGDQQNGDQQPNGQ
jgi:hypothetical protein